MKMPAVPLFVCAMMALTRAAEKSPIMKRSTSCPSGWTGYNGRCFSYIPTVMTWANAERHCQNLGGNLASVHSFNEQHAIQSMILQQAHAYPLTWLGGSDAAQEGTWFWSDGKPFRFNYWDKGQPDNYASAHCLVMNSGDLKKFDDQPCHYTKPFVCAMKP
ncbi:type-2 ice-structuring protein-like [Epinephelus lanceolatus]